jgi:uncharacterized protein (TIGR02266 family)
MKDPETPEPIPERRLYKRVPILVSVQVHFVGAGFVASTANLSAGGVFLCTERRLPPGTRLELKFSVPVLTKYPIRAQAEVVREGESGPRGFAVRFVDISAEDRELLAELGEKADTLLGVEEIEPED